MTADPANPTGLSPLELERAAVVASQAIQAAEACATSRNGRWTRKTSKREFDFVTDVDLEVERVMRGVLEGPGGIAAGVVGEELGGAGDLGHGRHWVIDPIDGTTNLLRSIPTFSVTLALVVDGEPQIGIVSAPMLGERYVALRGQGAWMERGDIRTPLAVSNEGNVAGSLVSVNDIYSLPEVERAFAGNITGVIAARSLQVRCHGSIGLDMAWVAAGRLEACVSFSNRPWDVVAGALLVTEAGGCTYDIDGGDLTSRSATVVGSTPAIREDLLGILRPVTERRTARLSAP